MTQTITQPTRFEVGQIAFCNGGCTMQLPTFYKVVRRTAKTVHAFIDKKTGDIFLPASWNAPAKGARFNLFQNKEALFEGVMRRPHGGYLYR